ncbi:MAG: GreA/GreB family elongation factor [Victivallales bacterium]|nr:GreA/GreB family elongation factor [Victivallales bacterium]
MADKSIFTNFKDYQNYLDGITRGNDEDMAAILSLMDRANRTGEEWPANFQKLFQTRLSKYFEKQEKRKIDSPTKLNLLRLCLAANLDSPALREKYAMLAKMQFNTYKDTDGLIAALGLDNEETPLAQVNQRWQMLREIKIAAICYDKDLLCGQVVALDDAQNQVELQFERRYNVPLKTFMDEYVVVKDLSSLQILLKGGILPTFREGRSYLKEYRESLAAGRPVTDELVKSILVPAVMSEKHFDMQVRGVREMPQTIAKEKEEAAIAELRWDDSRNVLELSERLKKVSTLNVEGETHWDNVERIINNGKDRAESVERFALAISLLLKTGNAEAIQHLYGMGAGISDALVWKDVNTCVDVSNKLPGKLAQEWFEYTAKVIGTDYLAKLAIRLPYRLWTYVEHTLKALGKQDELVETVKAALATNRVSCDVMYWLWRSNLDELKQKYIGEATLIFKTLRTEVKGDYLKAQRDLRRLLLDDEEFQVMVMRNGDHQAVIDLIRCVKRYPLLDTGEIQSILVKIAEIYPEYISDIEEKRAAKITIGKVTSIRAYNKRVAELNDLVDVQIPENTKAIEFARSLGDLSENSEYKYAKERQRMLGLRRREWEQSLVGMRATDFADVQLDNAVVPGCAVTLKYNDESTEVFYILGLLDSDPEKHIISYDSPLGKLLVGKGKGEKLTMPNGAKASIASIDKLPKEMYVFLADK